MHFQQPKINYLAIVNGQLKQTPITIMVTSNEKKNDIETF